MCAGQGCGGDYERQLLLNLSGYAELNARGGMVVSSQVTLPLTLTSQTHCAELRARDQAGSISSFSAPG